MKRLKRHLLTLGGIAGLISVAFLATGWGSAIAANISRVFVTNTSSTPVPVAGTVTIANTPTVNLPSGSTVSVGNTPSVNLAPSGNTVSVGNTPSVKLDPNGNLVDVSAHLAQQYTVQLAALWNTSLGDTESFQIPPGKAFVVQHVNAYIDVPVGESALLAADLTDTDGQSHLDYLPLERQSAQISGLTKFILDEDVTLVIGSGSVCSISFIQDAISTTKADANMTLTGYLDNAP